MALAVAVGAVAAGLSVGGWAAAGCYVVAGVSGLYGGYVLVLGVGWRFVSRALTSATTSSFHREAASLGQSVVELRFKAGVDEAETDDDDVTEVDRIMDDISAALGGAGDCPQADSSGGDHRLYVRSADVESGVNAVRQVAARHTLPAGSYIWIPEPTQPRMGRRLTL